MLPLCLVTIISSAPGKLRQPLKGLIETGFPDLIMDLTLGPQKELGPGAGI